MTPEPAPMAGKTVLVTGGTGGIGKATATRLATLGARVGITGRDDNRARAAVAAIKQQSGNPAVDAFVADMSSQTEVRRLAAAVLDAYPRLDVLVNNVGGFWAHRRVTTDGLEHTFAVNHLAPFLLTNLLLDRLKTVPRRGSSMSRPMHRRWGASISTICRAPRNTRVREPTTSPNLPTSCSPTNCPAAWPAPG
ncbi:MAG: SDR family NAD(P)-dependent oxidoreductase [Nakamurella sp.]